MCSSNDFEEKQSKTKSKKQLRSRLISKKPMSLILATASYAALIDEHHDALPFMEYVNKQGFMLNDRCVHIFYQRIIHSKETDFVEID